ncbi:MAG: S8 family serine peptidase [Thermoanaerobaculia bacterium]
MFRKALLAGLCVAALPAASFAQQLAPYEKVIHQSVSRLPRTGHTVTVMKVYDPVLDTSRELALEGGVPVDLPRLLEEEQQLKVERLGNLHPALAKKLEAGRAQRLRVLIRFGIDEPTADKSLAVTETQLASLAQQSAAADSRLAQRAAAMFQQRLDRLAVKDATLLSVSGPFVAAELPASAIAELGKDRGIAFIGLLGKEIYDNPTITQSLPTTWTDSLQATGNSGAGVKIAVLESGTLWKPAACFNILATQTASGSVNWHMTNSPGLIGNRFNNATGGCDGTLTGYAPAASVLLANASLYPDRYDWAKTQGANVITMSWHEGTEETSGSISSRDIYFDYWTTRPPYPTIFTSAGNQAGSNAFSSGKGFNFFGVGNVTNDGDGNRCNDVMDPTSSWINPTSAHGDHEAPAIASPGSLVDLLGSTFGGTSAATPVTASIAADVMSSNAALKFWPEAVRALLLASATYQGSDGANYSKFADGKDGAGLTNGYYAYLAGKTRETTATPQYRAHDYGTLTAGSFANGYLTKTWTVSVATVATRVRAALVWDSNVQADIDGNPLSSILDLDLDLYLYDPNGNLVATGSTFDNAWELIDYQPAMTGNYTLKVRAFSLPQSFSRYFGIAWSQHQPLLVGC